MSKEEGIDGLESSENDNKMSKVAGRKGDPRMNLAVSTRESNPTMRLSDALRAGGFDFPDVSCGDENSSTKCSMIEDSDGVKLSQRKNQLIRRLRVARHKRGGGSAGGTDDSVSISSQAHYFSYEHPSLPRPKVPSATDERLSRANSEIDRYRPYPDSVVSATNSQNDFRTKNPEAKIISAGELLDAKAVTATLASLEGELAQEDQRRQHQLTQTRAAACYFNTSSSSLHSDSNVPIHFAAKASALSSPFTGLPTSQNLLYTHLGYQAFPNVSNSRQTQVQSYLETTRGSESSCSPFLSQCTPSVNRFSNTNALTLSSLTRQLQDWERLQSFRDQESKAAISNLLQGTQVHESLLHCSKYSKLYCLSSGPIKVAVKVMNKPLPEPIELENFYNEFELTQHIQHAGIRKVFSKTVFMDKPALLLEWIEGVTIKDYGKFAMKDFLKAAREIASALVTLHSESVMHNNLSTDNILYQAETRTVKIIGFSSSSRFSINNSCIGYRNINQDMNYAPPETLGRVNSLVDFRADFYSLGVLFYLMITGKLPFESTHKFDLMRKHIFDTAEPLHNIDTNIPIPVSDFVSKLMQKNADDRYQSTKGILHDLDWMLSEFDTDTQLKSIRLSQHDFSEYFLVSQRLYGRDLETSLLLSAFHKVKKEGAEFIVIRGDAGSGKSALAFDFYKRVFEHKGVFVNGKFDQSQKKVPYSALLRACENYCDLLLEEDEESLIKHRRKIQESLGEEGKFLTDVIENLHLVIGPQSNVVNTIGKESKHRFNYVFCKFLNVISSAERPLVMFIDDMQWADCDSLLFLSVLMANKSIRHLMIVGAYRQNEVTDDQHPLKVMLRSMKENRVTVSFIEVLPLGMADVNEIISDALHSKRLETYSLTSIVLRKTHGNPFFVVQFLRMLSELKLVQFSFEQREWMWDSDKIEKQNLTDNVVQFLIDKLLNLDESTQKCLSVASCIGNSFSLSTLKLATTNHYALESALSNGLVVPAHLSRDTTTKYQYQFAHDQIQLAASSLIPESEWKTFQFHNGHTLWKNSSEDELYDNLYVVVNLLNSGLDAMSSSNSMDQELTHIARLNLQAGEKAKLSASYKLASWYFISGIAWADTSKSKSNSNIIDKSDELLSLLYNRAAEAYFCLSSYELMEKMIEEGLKRASSLIESTSLISLRIRALCDQRCYDKCIAVGMDMLQKLGETFIIEVNDIAVGSEFYKVLRMLQDRSNDEITKLVTTDKTTLAAMDILNHLFTPCYNFNPSLLPLIILRNVQLSLHQGVTLNSSYGFASLGVFLCGKLGDISSGFRSGQLAVKLLEKFEAKSCLPRVYASVFMCINHWVQHIHNSIDPLMESYRIGLEVGSHDYGFYGASGFCMYSLISGKPLEKLNEHLTMFDSQLPTSARGFKFESCHFTVLRFIRNISSKSSHMEPKSFSDNDLVFGCFHFMFLAYFFKDYDIAKEWQSKCIHLLDHCVIGTYHSSLFEFYNALVALASIKIDDTATSIEQVVQISKKSVEKLKNWCKFSPENYENKLYLLQAEIAVIEKNDTMAVEYYEKAISTAKQNSFIHEEALACERAGYYYRQDSNQIEKAKEFLLRSYILYSDWGATNKARQLEQYDIFSAGHDTNGSSKNPALTDLLLEHQSTAISEITGSCFNATNNDDSASKRTHKRIKRLSFSAKN